ncbi:MAG TPA: nucleotidyltransferase family protein, partial [Pyrinomonadaceae bacterium]|nr:nucleotidyltransferase family protein [Pyrinomonadaceae bacterium]
VRAFRANNIEPVLIKGWAAARNYPAGKFRFYGDIDLAVSAESYHRAQALIEREDSPIKGVDLHRELRHLDTLSWDDHYSRSELVPVDGDEIRVLAPEDHLRVLCVHWLTNGGEDKERLFDIVYAVENRPASFDWARCLDVVSLNRRSWLVATIGLAHKYLGLAIEDLPFADEARRLPDWLTKCVERGWSGQVRLRGLDESITDRGLFVKQIGRRLPPNPIQSTVFCEGAFDDGPRIGYQIRDIVGRIRPSVRRISRAIVDQYRWSRAK